MKNCHNLSIFEVYRILSEYYGLQNWWPLIQNGECVYLIENAVRKKNISESIQIAIGAILTQNTSWSNVIPALIKLEKEKLFNIQALIEVPEDFLAESVRSTGYFRQKAKKIKIFSLWVQNLLSGNLDNLKLYNPEVARTQILKVWGIGEETADSILLYSCDINFFVVDAYTRRIFSRLGFIETESSYSTIQKLFESNLKQDTFIYKEYHALIVAHAKRYCKKKPLCEECILRNVCCYSE